MARAKDSFGALRVIGNVGGYHYQHSRSGQIVQLKSRSGKPNTALQQIQRNSMRICARAWSEISESRRADWERWTPESMSTYQYFVSAMLRYRQWFMTTSQPAANWSPESIEPYGATPDKRLLDLAHVQKVANNPIVLFFTFYPSEIEQPWYTIKRYDRFDYKMPTSEREFKTWFQTGMNSAVYRGIETSIPKTVVIRIEATEIMRFIGVVYKDIILRNGVIQ